MSRAAPSARVSTPENAEYTAAMTAAATGSALMCPSPGCAASERRR